MKHPAERIADICCAFFIVFAVLYFCGHIFAAWLRGSFEVLR